MNTRLRACLLKSSLLFSPSGLEGFLILRSQKIVSKRPTPSSPYGRATAVASPLAPLDLERICQTITLGYPEWMKRGTQKSKLGAMSVKGSVTLLQNVLTLRRYGRMKEAMNATWSETLEMTLHLKAMRRGRIEDQDSDESDCEEHNLEGPKAWVLHDLYDKVCILITFLQYLFLQSVWDSRNGA